MCTRFMASIGVFLLLGCGSSSTTGDTDEDTAVETPEDISEVTDTGDEPDVETEPDVQPDTEPDPVEDPGEEETPADCPVPGDHGPGQQGLDIPFDGRDRHYIAYVPDSYDPAAPTPLIINIHGYMSADWQQILFSQMNDAAALNGFIVIYPNGLGSSWNAGSCCGTSASTGVDDVGFLKHVVDDAATRWCIDRRRVYATGMSNGGYMSHRLACEASDVFAAVAPVAGAMGIPDCSPPRPMPVIGYHGIQDGLVDYTDGHDAFDEWVALNGCSDETVREDYGDSYCFIHETCDGGVETGFCTLDPMGHCWPGGSSTLCLPGIGPFNGDIPANQHMWSFMSRFTLP